tara:strand:- start:7736 stop:8635 length:900 start_codon:yes stop_codon:yes gene_type:complete
MKKFFKFLILSPPKLILYLVRKYAYLLGYFLKIDIASQIFSSSFLEFENRTQRIVHINNNKREVNLDLYTPNAMCKMRADTFSSKEPEILSWIDKHGGDHSFWDIGSNIGLYSIYYGLTQSGRVVSFEPSVFNLKQLAKNISLNGLSEKIDLNPIPLSDSTGYAEFAVSSLEEGSAQNAFGVDYGFDGNDLNRQVNYSILGMSGDEIIKSGYIEKVPKMIKLDVDGIEHLILEGMKEILLSENCYSVFVEVNDDFQEQSSQVEKILTQSGFELSEKTHAELHDRSTKYSKTFNQIWFKV